MSINIGNEFITSEENQQRGGAINWHPQPSNSMMQAYNIQIRASHIDNRAYVIAQNSLSINSQSFHSEGR